MKDTSDVSTSQNAEIDKLIWEYETKLKHGAGSSEWMAWCRRAYAMLKTIDQR